MAQLLTATPPALVTDRERWYRTVRSDLRSIPSQRPEWLDAVCHAGGYRDATQVLQARDGRDLVLPMVARGSARWPGRQHSLPYGWGPAGLLAQDGVVTPEDVAQILSRLVHTSSRRVSVRPSPLTASAWREAVPSGIRRTQHMAQSVDIRNGFPALWKSGFTSQGRRGVRRAEREGVTVERDDQGRLLPVYQDLYRKSVDRWARANGRPVQIDRWVSKRTEPPSKVAEVSRRLGADLRTYVARVGQSPAAAIVVAFGPHSAAYWRGAMDETYRSAYPNYLLHRAAIEDACARGLTFYHMGDSAPGSELARFKKQFGAQELHYESYHLEPRHVTVAERARRRVTEVALQRIRSRHRPR